MTQSDFAVIVPAYNEAPVIKDLVRELRQSFERHDLHGEVVLVDDGSTDDTAALAIQEADGWEAFKVVRHKMNQGKTEAMLTGAASTEKSYLVLFDADLQHSPDEIPRFLERLADGFDIGCAEAFLNAGEAVGRRLGLAHEVWLEGHHAGAGEEQGRVARRDDGRAGHNAVL